MAAIHQNKARKSASDPFRADDGPGTIWSLGYFGNPVEGTAASDFLLAQSAGTINGYGGDDLILGDIGLFSSAISGNNSFANATDLDFAIWSTDENPLFADDAVPHATIHILAEAGTGEFFKIVIGAGQTLTVDIDGAGGSLGSGTSTDTIVYLYAASNLTLELAISNDSAITAGGYGSMNGLDSYLVFTNTGATATFFFEVDEFGAGAFEADDEFLLNVSLTGHAVGNPSPAQNNDTINGLEGDDHVFGAGGNDILIGGPGTDLMVGGSGDDEYRIVDVVDIIVEDPGEGNDLATTSISYALTANASVETLRANFPNSSNTMTLTGSSIANLIEGNAAANILNGEGGNDTLNGFEGHDYLVGGAGADVMTGGLGDDSYWIDDGADAITELAGQGNDTVYASIGYILAVGVSIETISTTSQSGTSALALWGNEIAQSIFGNEGNNQLLGLGGNDQLVGYGGNDVLVGGAGIDYLRGGIGDDVYGIGEGDVILENAGEGDDSLAADIGSYFLTDGASIETLSTANQAGTFAQNLTGNELGQSVAGSEGANVLNGRGGIDLLRGYGGADIFLFDAAPNSSSNWDVIADMQLGVDKIALQNAVFTGLAEGNLGAGAFRLGNVAQDADDRILYDQANGRLFFDSDGNGANAAILFAVVNGSPGLQASDFMIV